MPLVPVLHPVIKLPLVFGWPPNAPLPPLTSDAFGFEALYPSRALQIVIGPHIDKAAEAALQLLLSSPFSPDVDCVSVVFHLFSFTEDLLRRIERYIAPASSKEIRIIDPARQYENTSISIFRNGQILQSWILVTPADEINDRLGTDLAASPALVSLKILPPNNPETFRRNYHLFLGRVFHLLQSVVRLQRLILPLDFMLGDMQVTEAIFDLLRGRSYLEELQLPLPTVIGVDGDCNRDQFFQETVLFWSKLFKIKKLMVPARFIRNKLLPPTHNAQPGHSHE